MDIKTSHANISDVLLVTVEPSDLLDLVVFEWSYNSSISPVEPVGASNLD